MVRRALLLANDSFADASIPALASPCSDGEKLRDLLMRDDVGGYDVTYCANANSVDARIAVQRFFREANAADFNLVLISGHGIRDSQGHLHFATADTRSDVLAATSLDSAFVIKQMDLSSASKQVAIIDTCFSGAFVQGMTAKAATQKISSTDFANSDMDDIRGRAVITASTHIQTANENEKDGETQSIFTRHLIEGIESGAADADQDGEIALPELFKYISDRLRAEGNTQTPKSFDYGLGGQAVVALNPAYKPAALPAALAKRLASKSKAQKLMAVEQLQAIAASSDPASGLAVEALNRLLRDDYAIVQTMARDALDSLGAQPMRGDGPKNVSAPSPGETVKPEPKPVEELIKQAETALTRVRQPIAEPSPQPPLKRADLLDSRLISKSSKKLVWLGLSVATIIALIMLYGFVQQMKKARDEMAMAAQGDASFDEADTAAEGAAAAAAAGPDLNQATAGLAGKWALADRSGCGNPAISITVWGPELKINEQSFARDITTVDANGWMKIGDGYYKLSDPNTLLVVADLAQAASADRFVKCP